MIVVNQDFQSGVSKDQSKIRGRQMRKYFQENSDQNLDVWLIRLFKNRGKIKLL
jgi:hypothetical protein